MSSVSAVRISAGENLSIVRCGSFVIPAGIDGSRAVRAQAKIMTSQSDCPPTKIGLDVATFGLKIGP